MSINVVKVLTSMVGSSKNQSVDHCQLQADLYIVCGMPLRFVMQGTYMDACTHKVSPLADLCVRVAVSKSGKDSEGPDREYTCVRYKI